MPSMNDLARLEPIFLIMTGLDPVIFSTAQKEDARVKRGHDERK